MNCLQALATALLVSATVSAPIAAADYPPVDVEMRLQQVSPHVWYAQGAAGAATENAGFISNAAVVIGTDAVAVVDALGSPSLGAKLLDRVRALTDRPVRYLVVTHYHADHIYGLQAFEQTGAEVIAPVGALEYLASPAAQERIEERRWSLAPWVNQQTRLVEPDRLVDGTTRLDLGGVALTLTWLGAAHSDGDLSVLVEPDQVLISGDVIFEGRLPFVGDADTGHWISVLERMKLMGPKALVPGHGPAATDPVAAVSLTLDYLRFLREAMGVAVDEMTPFAEAYAQTDWSRYQQLPAFEAANRRNAYGVYLSLERESLE